MVGSYSGGGVLAHLPPAIVFIPCGDDRGTFKTDVCTTFQTDDAVLFQLLPMLTDRLLDDSVVAT
jgi:hypothetical protein